MARRSLNNSSVRMRSSVRAKMSEGSAMKPSLRSCSTTFSPRPSMSKPLRETKWEMASLLIAGQV